MSPSSLCLKKQHSPPVEKQAVIKLSHHLTRWRAPPVCSIGLLCHADVRLTKLRSSPSRRTCNKEKKPSGCGTMGSVAVIEHYYQVGKQIGVGSYWDGLHLRNSTARALEALLLELDFGLWAAFPPPSPPGD
jgi:hypothetical protein